MTIVNIEIKKNHLKAVAYAMATKNIRFYLCGVYVEFDNANQRLVATDGHRVHLVHESLGRHTIERISFIIPLDMVQKMIKAKPGIIMVEYNDGTKMITWDNMGQKTSMQAIEGKFPDWRRVVGKAGTHEPELGFYNPAYVLDTNLAVRDYLDISKKSQPLVMFTPRGEQLGFVAVEGLFCGVMPMRGEHGNFINPGLFA